MCVNFRPPDPEMLDAVMGVIIDLHDTGFWRTETWKDYGAPIVRRGADGKRALVIVPRAEWDDWLDCKDPEYARSFLRHYPAEKMRAWEFPVPPRSKKAAQDLANQTGLI